MVRPVSSLKRLIVLAASITTLTSVLWTAPSFAKDPFRTTNPRPINDTVESAFNAMFKDGNYVAGEKYLQKATGDEPLAYALKAAIAYLKQDFTTFDTQAKQITKTAEKLVATDPLRGNLYLAVGNFFEGASIYTKDKLTGLPAALGKLQDVFRYMNAAVAIDPKDPEVSLLKGYMDMLLATNLPFSNPDDAIKLLLDQGSPKYLAYRGAAIAYRDTRKLDQALNAVNQSIADTPNNPEMFYLKAQVLFKQKNFTDSITWFDKALAKKDQLPGVVVKDILGERDRAAQLAQSKPALTPTAASSSSPIPTAVSSPSSTPTSTSIPTPTP